MLRGAHRAGYAFQASRATDYLDVAIVSLHMAIAIAHIPCLFLTRLSSECWDTLEELLSLALTLKTDIRILKNICVGIKRLSTIGFTAMIRGKKSRTLANRAKSDNQK